MKVYALGAVCLVLAACRTPNAAPGAGSSVKDTVSGNDSARVCQDAGIANIESGDYYRWNFGVSGSDPTHIWASAYFAWDATFRDSQNSRENAIAQFDKTLVMEIGKPLKINYQGGIANLRHTTEDFKLYMGYKINGEDKWMEMTWRESPNTTYTSYDLEWTPQAVNASTVSVWFEARYRQNGRDEKSYDSNNGMNYSAQIVGVEAKSACFTRDWREAIDGGELRAGETVQVVYDPQRIYQLLRYTTYNGYPAWSARLFYQIYNSSNSIVAESMAPITAHVSRARDGQPATNRPHFNPKIRIPEGTSGGRLVIWVRGIDRGSGAWDSDHGANYVFPIL